MENKYITSDISEISPMLPFCVYEEEKEERKNEREHHMTIIKCLLAALIISIILGIASNMAWIAYENTFDKVSYTQDGEGVNNVNLGEQGDVLNEPNGNSETKETTHDKK